MVLKRLLKTKHRAVILNLVTNTERCMEVGPRQKVPVFDLRDFVNKLRYYIGTHDWDSILNDSSDIDSYYARFLETLDWSIDMCIPCKLVAVGPHNLDSITSRVKLLSWQRYHLRKQGRREGFLSRTNPINLLYHN